jgi:GntP family gluconate:H+ symporter
MVFGLHPGILLAIAVVLFLVLHVGLKWAMPFAFVVVSVVIAFLGDFGFPFRHLVEGGFGFINLFLGLFAGAFFGHALRKSGGADAAAAGIVKIAGGRPWLVLIMAGLPMFVVGMFSGLGGVAVLAGGVFAVPALRRLGYKDDIIAAFIAVISTAGMVAPPVNVPMMMIADGVNMPFTNVATSLWTLVIPTLIAAVAWFAYVNRKGVTTYVAETVDNGAFLRGIFPILVAVAIWVVARTFGTVVVDPASPLILVIGGLVTLPFVARKEVRNVAINTFSGTPLLLAAALVSIGMFIQILTLTGVRGWLVVSIMSLEFPFNYLSFLVGLPIVGGVLSSLGNSAILAVPIAFSFIHQNMILNAAALSALSAVSEFVAPTAVSAALACYVVGGTTTVGQVFRWAWPPMLVLMIAATIMLAFAPLLTGILT